MNFLIAVPFRILLWMVPIFFMIHNMEEALFMERWSKRLPVKIHPAVSTPRFVVAVTFLTISGFVLTYISLVWLPTSIGYLLILGMQAVLLVNAFIPHLATTIRFRLYSPGIVTVIVLIIPFSLYLFRRAFTEQLLTWAQFWLLIWIAPFAMVALTLLSLQVGKVLTRKGFPGSCPS
jgi:membrane-bound acyltransferase YfiQ involved in biofilm formation